ncbi:hypothetical protein chiPu_0031470, partial [Chiloscyllium punctatum]|nr:hypothetical protein [Chiloscyllium punctatum]
LGGELVALARGGADRHGKAVVDDAGDAALDAADMVEIGDHAIADIADTGRQQREAARRHVDNLAGKLAPVGQHVAAEQVHLDALEAAPLLGYGDDVSFLLCKRHHDKPGHRPFGAPMTLKLIGLTGRYGCGREPGRGARAISEVHMRRTRTRRGRSLRSTRTSYLVSASIAGSTVTALSTFCFAARISSCKGG